MFELVFFSSSSYFWPYMTNICIHVLYAKDLFQQMEQKSLNTNVYEIFLIEMGYTWYRLT